MTNALGPRVYVAASSLETTRALAVSEALRIRGATVVSTWLDTIAKVGEANPRDATRDARRHWSIVDLAEVQSADVLWVLVPDRPSRGCWVECGFAYGVGKPIVCSGDTKVSIFSALGAEFAYDDDALAYVLQQFESHPASSSPASAASALEPPQDNGGASYHRGRIETGLAELAAMAPLERK